MKTDTHDVISVGYERRSVDDLMKRLRAEGVKTLLDVRELPLSRRKGFSKTALREVLESNGIAYVHVREAGNPYRHLAADPERCLALYAKHVDRHPEVVRRVAGMLNGTPTAMLCFEREHSHCHRSVLLDAIAKAGFSVSVTKLE